MTDDEKVQDAGPMDQMKDQMNDEKEKVKDEWGKMKDEWRKRGIKRWHIIVGIIALVLVIAVFNSETKNTEFKIIDGTAYISSYSVIEEGYIMAGGEILRDFYKTVKLHPELKSVEQKLFTWSSDTTDEYYLDTVLVGVVVWDTTEIRIAKNTDMLVQYTLDPIRMAKTTGLLAEIDTAAILKPWEPNIIDEVFDLPTRKKNK